MKIIGNFLQTYSANRIETANFLSQDLTLNYFLNKLDKKYFSFHNGCSIDYCKKYANIVKKNFNNVEFLIYTEPQYTHTITRHIKMLREQKCTDLFFTQDDVICTVPNNHKYILDSLYSFYKDSPDVNLLSLNIKGSRLIKAGVKPLQTRVISDKHNIVAYEFWSTDFAKANLFEMDDSTYFANLDFVEWLYDEEYRKFYNMDEAESYVKKKCTYTPVKRWALNKRMFRYFYYHGMHVYNRFKEINVLSRLLRYKSCIS